MMIPSPATRRIGILGGSFDPIHFGHLIIAQDALERLELSEVVFIPAAIPPHKRHLQQVASEHRINMVRLAIEADIRFSVSDIEIQRGGTSYTIDTVMELKQQYGEADLFLVVGSDTLVEFHTWKNFDRLIQLCDIATLVRPGDGSLDEIAAQVRQLPAVKARLLANLIEAHRIDISSTEIRMRIAEGLRIHYLVPPEVEMYISEHGLYRG